MRKLLLVSMTVILFSCGGGNSVKTDRYRVPDKYNLKIVVYNGDITDPSHDRRCYYRVYIDKVEKGRTGTGLESQEKTFETKLRGKRHLFTLEKWILDTKRGRYRKVNNVRQPKPSFYYFTVPEKRILVVTGRITRGSRIEFTESFEKE